MPDLSGESYVDLFWMPLGAGDTTGLIRHSGRAYEALAARHDRRSPRALYHSALEVVLRGTRYVIEMTPTWGLPAGDRGVVAGGAVGLPLLGRSTLFHYEVHRWRDGVIPDLITAVGGARRLSDDEDHARRVLDLVPDFPAGTWGRDEQDTGDMWNSNSLTSWLLARSGHDVGTVAPPGDGRAPGWSAGLAVASRHPGATARHPVAPVRRRGWRSPHPSWRATAAEREAQMPGDELIATARYRSTRAVDIAAPASTVWPWLVQMGQGRGGLYSYDWLENLLGLHMHSAHRVEPHLQHLEVGDRIRLVPEGTEPPLRFTVARIEPPHVLVWGSEGTLAAAVAAGLPHPCWTFQAVDQPSGGSRLLVRFQCDFDPTPMGSAMYKYGLTPVHLVMERKMLLGIKARAEGAR
ncbi:hypothetical protein [Nocardioides zhouii]|uniref:hypothetical protein n=1 Tax=Nocardioides zhouii TaxID=1168729 RepID=UPI001A9288E9|nr:hypothetical protein [Nocardioides zhouii]